MSRKVIYDGLTKCEKASLSQMWKGYVSRDSDWDYARDFLLWAQDSGYIVGARLRRRDTGEPYSPGNCYWEIVEKCFPKGHPCRECERRNGCSNPCPERLRHWDDTMNHIRANFGDVKRKDEI